MSSPSWAETPAVGLQPPALTPSSLPAASCSWCQLPAPCSHRDGTCPTAFPISSGAFLLPSLSSPRPERVVMGTPWGQDGGFHSLSPSLAAPSRWLAWSRSCGTALWPSTGTKCHTSTSTRGCERRLLRELSRPSGPLPAPHPLSRAQRHYLTLSAQPGGWSWGRLAQSLPPSAASRVPIGGIPPPSPNCIAALNHCGGLFPRAGSPSAGCQGPVPSAQGADQVPGPVLGPCLPHSQVPILFTL